MRTRSVVLAVVTILIACLASSAWAKESVRIALDEPVEINGRVFDAAFVQVTEIQHYAPDTTMNEIRVGTQWVGMALAREESSSRSRGPSALTFVRRADGMLVLEGVALRDEPTRRFMAFRSVDGHGEWFLPASPVAKLAAAEVATRR